MLPLALSLLAADPAGVMRQHFGTPHLPAGCKAEVVDGPGLQLTIPPGVRTACDEELTRDGGACWVSRNVEGDFQVVARVRLRFDTQAGAAGVTAFRRQLDGREVAEAFPTVAAGLYVDGPGVNTRAYVRYERKGERRQLQPGFFVNRVAGGRGGQSLRPLDGVPGAIWLRVKKSAGSVALATRMADDPPQDWNDSGMIAGELPDVAGLRLFATGNLDKPYSVEFDHLTVTPLPPDKK